jgi:hypothetical protein
MDAHLYLASKQDDIFARWQLTDRRWSDDLVRSRARVEGWRTIHSGVYTRLHGPLTQRQLWIAAVLTARTTYLDGLSAGACHGFHEWTGPYEMVVRPGNGGSRKYPGLLVARSQTLVGATTRVAGIPVVTAERALVRVAPLLTEGQRGRAFRESIRLKVTTANDIARALNGQRGTAGLRSLCDRYATIPYHRCRSDAECRGLEVLCDAGIPLPDVNVRVAGREADYVWRKWKLIIEIDSKEFHPFPADDAAKQARWEAAGYTVLRIWANDIYYRPTMLLALVNVPN